MPNLAEALDGSGSGFRWAIGGLLTALVTMTLLVFANLERRVTVLELENTKTTVVLRDLSVELSAVNANQITVMQQLDVNSEKLDRIITVVYRQSTRVP
jgi:hypothetical protein